MRSIHIIKIWKNRSCVINVLWARRGFIDLGSQCRFFVNLFFTMTQRPQINKTSPCQHNIDYTTPILLDFDDNNNSMSITAIFDHVPAMTRPHGVSVPFFGYSFFSLSLRPQNIIWLDNPLHLFQFKIFFDCRLVVQFSFPYIVGHRKRFITGFILCNYSLNVVFINIWNNRSVSISTVTIAELKTIACGFIKF